MTSEKNYQHWRLVQDEENILWLYLDKHDANVNTLSQAILQELQAILDEIENIRHPRGVVLLSGKKNGFIAGADIKEIAAANNVEAVLALIRLGHTVFARLAALSMPTVAVIHGFCLGGGLELALACRYRIASDSTETKLGLPEVMLGIHPGWGGTVRLPALIGPQHALDLMVTGRSISGKKAKKMGLVEYVLPEGYLLVAARDVILRSPKNAKPSILSKILESSLVRPWFVRAVRNKLNKKVNRNHYPAPFAIVDLWEQYGGGGQAAFEAEINSIATLTQHPTTQNLIRIFFLRERLKEFGKNNPISFKHVHIIGAGVMGGDIAVWCALSGLTVTVEDVSQDKIADTLARAEKMFSKKLEISRKVQSALDKLTPDPNGFGIRRADIVIEAVAENMDIKKSVWKKIEAHARSSAILATNTSSFSLDELSAEFVNPERLLGIHFFNPVSLMPLVEVVKSSKTNEKHFNNALAFVQKISKLPLPVVDNPGFLVNRVLFVYLAEAFMLLQEGVPMEVIDKAAEDFGMPMGPIELADTVGLDVCYSVAKNLARDKSNHPSMEKLAQLVAAGQLGKKADAGFYTYKKGKAQKGSVPARFTGVEHITQRLMLSLINEAARCMQDHIVDDADLIDAGMIFGAGFAPYLGGPLHYAKTVGIDKIRSDLTALTQQYGSRFEPSAWWRS